MTKPVLFAEKASISVSVSYCYSLCIMLCLMERCWRNITGSGAA